MSNKTFLITFTVIAFLLGGVFYVLYPTPNEYETPKPKNNTDKVVCTADAKMCPDGSYVGREGPNCEFKACPIPEGAIMEDGTIIE